MCVITTENRRGGYISNICKKFGYTPIRVPDESKDGNYFLRIRKIIKDEAQASVAITFDGPLGPLHEPKVFPFAIALFAKRRVVPVSIYVKRKIILKHRWDKFIIPLPFNDINVYVHDPITVDKQDLKDEFEKLRKEAKEMMLEWEKNFQIKKEAKNETTN